MMLRTATLSLATLLLAAMVQAQTAPPSYDPRTAFAETDKNGDGRVDYEEFIERTTDVYYLADTNKDGKHSAAEVEAATLQTTEMIAVDSNRDGGVTLGEFQRQRLHAFDAADTDHSGTLSLTEVTTAFEKAGK